METSRAAQILGENCGNAFPELEGVSYDLQWDHVYNKLVENGFEIVKTESVYIPLDEMD